MRLKVLASFILILMIFAVLTQILFNPCNAPSGKDFWTILTIWAADASLLFIRLIKIRA